LEDYFDRELGPTLRVVWFQELLADPDYVARQLAVDFPSLKQTLFKLGFPLTSRIMRFGMGINPGNAEACRTRVLQHLDRLEAEIRPSGYLAGDTFTVADLTAAALLSPVLMPPEFPYPFLSGVPAPALAWRELLLKRPALQWAGETYRRHRGKSTAVGEG
jgi:glutathione S-transferase